MKERGKSISIYLPDGNPRGLKICDTPNSVIKAVQVPRNRFKNLNRDELSNPGIYFLLNKSEETGKLEVYIGEAEVLMDRIQNHNQNKDFWNILICFISDKGNLNKAYIKYLEYIAISEAKRINRCQLENSVTPKAPSLQDRERDFVLDFFDDLKLLLGALGYPIFEELQQSTVERSSSGQFVCQGKGVRATALYTEEGMLILEGSTVSPEISASYSKGFQRLRQELIDTEVLLEFQGSYKVTKDYLFNSPSTAAAITLGRNANGWTEWKNSKGKTLDSVYRNVE